MKENSISLAHAQMRKGMLEFCTMLIIEKGEAYVSDLLKKLKEADLIVVEGTLYPLLSRLKSQGQLDYSWEESKAGPPRKYYSLTSEGRKSLQEMKEIWKELAQSINTLLK
ncbi:MAG TPA: PadR family transcriptional regulator [Candidatus Paceibacterota bacterium]